MDPAASSSPPLSRTPPPCGSNMPSLRYDSDDSDADINDLLLPAPLVGELEEDDELQLPAPLVGELEQATQIVIYYYAENQWRGPRHVHYLWDELHSSPPHMCTTTCSSSSSASA